MPDSKSVFIPLNPANPCPTERSELSEANPQQLKIKLAQANIKAEFRSMILILGARSDLARAIAHQCAAEGHDLYLAARNADRLAADCKDLNIRHGIQAQAVEFDALDTASHQAFYEQLMPKPETVFCVFGLMTDQDEAAQDWSKAEAMLAVNYTGAASILHHIANEMQSRKSGNIVGISSVAGDRGRASNYYYGSAKAGFTTFLSGLRNRLTISGVHVMTVKPGFMQTAMTEGLDLPAPLTASPPKAARDILKALHKKKNILYTKWMWKWIMMIIRNVPESIFKKMKL